jgi:hypothetical protein
VYVRLTAAPKDVYEYLEPFYMDYRKLAWKKPGKKTEKKRFFADKAITDSTFGMLHMDECVEQLLNEKLFCNLVLPPMVRRYKLEEGGVLAPRVSPLQAELDELAARQAEHSSNSDEKKKKKKKKKKEKREIQDE